MLLLPLLLWALNETCGTTLIPPSSAALFCLDESSENTHFLYGAWILSVLISQDTAFDSKPFRGCVPCHDMKAQTHNYNNNEIRSRWNEGLWGFICTAWSEFQKLSIAYFCSKNNKVKKRVLFNSSNSWYHFCKMVSKY